MERHFPIKLGQPIEMAAVILNSFTEFPNQDKEPVCQKWNGEFRSEYSDRNMWTTSRSDPDIFRSEETETNDRNFRNLLRNGKHPMKSSAPCLPLTDKMKWGQWLGTRRESKKVYKLNILLSCYSSRYHHHAYGLGEHYNSVIPAEECSES